MENKLAQVCVEFVRASRVCVWSKKETRRQPDNHHSCVLEDFGLRIMISHISTKYSCTEFQSVLCPRHIDPLFSQAMTGAKSLQWV